MNSSLTWPLPLLATAAALLAALPAAALDPASSVVVLPGSVHPLAAPRFDQGRVDGAAWLSGASLTLAPSAARQSELERLLADQQDPSSASYHRWLTPEQYADRFGPTAAEVGAASAWLRSQGLTVEGVARGRGRLSFSGPVSRVEAAFRTQLHRYLVDGESHYANASAPSVPGALAGVAAGVLHLDDFRIRPRARLRRADPRFTSSISGNHFLTPDDFATIYDLQPLYAAGLTGAGQTIAVVGQTAIDLVDVAAFRAASGLAARPPKLVLVPGSGLSAAVKADLDEAALDVEWAGGVARDAQVLYVYTGNSPSFGVLDALQYAVDQQLAPVISISYGDCEAHFSAAETQALRQALQQANAQGQTVSAASGDFGAADCESGSVTTATTGLAVDLPSSAPEATGVGGSSFSADLAAPGTYWNSANDPLNGSALSYIPEATWNESGGALAAGGGGVSTLFAKPSWQSGAGVPADGKRDVPDLALSASPSHDGYLVCSQGSCVTGYRDASNGLTVVGGTSAGAPAFAGLLAILNQAAGASGLGNVNGTLYALAASTPGAFHDVASGDNTVPCTSGTTGCPTSPPYRLGYAAGSGYDQATGLGSPDALQLVSAWPAVAAATPGFALTSSGESLSLAAGQSGVVTLDVIPVPLQGFTKTVSFACSGLPAGASCAFSPASVTPSGALVKTALTIQTTGATAALLGRPRRGGRTTFYALLIPGTLGLARTRRRRSRRVHPLGLAAAALLAALAASACGGGGASSSARLRTPAGSSTVTVTATSAGSPALSHAVQLALTVQ